MTDWRDLKQKHHTRVLTIAQTINKRALETRYLGDTGGCQPNSETVIS
ncbi:MAG: hypothetical protein SAK29_30875 [Scytonema sp. PMC 1069.18]|nr:hypothetical protein [Scytonema sp. PMC 1069.18]